MHDGDWQWVEGVLSKDMATISEYLQTWKLNFSTTKTVSAAFHLNKEAKRELNVKNNETLPFCSEPKYLGVMLDRSLTYRRHLESLRKTLTSRVALLRRLAGPSLGALNRRGLRACLVPQCSYPPYWPHHQQRRANSDWMPASYTSGQTFNPCRHPTCCALAQGSHTISRTQCHGAWTPAPLSAHPAIGCSCTAPQIETPICARRTTTHQFFWQQQQHMCGVVGVGGQPHKTPHFNSRHRYTPLWNDPPKKSLGPAQPPPHRCRTFPLLPVKMGYGLLCGLWVWCRTNRRPCRPPPSNPWTLPRTTRPDGSGQWDNQMAAQHLPRYPGGLAVDKRTHSNERRRSHRYCLQGDFPMPTDTLVQNFLSFLIYT